MKKQYQKVIKLLRYLVLLVFALVLALLLLPFFFQDELKESVKEYLNERVNATVDFSDIHLSALARFPKLKLNVEELSISDNTGFSQDSIFYTKELIFELPIYSLWQKNKPIEIVRIEIEDADLYMIIDSSAKKNYDILSANNDTTEKSPLAFKIKQFEIRDANIHYLDELSDQKFDLEDVSLKGSGDFNQSVFTLSSQAQINKIKYQQNQIPVIDQWYLQSEGDLLVDLNNNSYRIEDYKILLNKLLLDVDGVIEIAAEANILDITLKSKSSEFKDYITLLPNTRGLDFEKINASGKADLTAYAKGKLNPVSRQFPEFQIQSKVENGFAQFPGFAIPIKDINGEIFIQHLAGSLDETTLNLKNFKASVNGETIKTNVRATNLFSDPLLDARLEGKLNLNDFASAYPLPGITKLDGRIESQVSILGRNSQIQNGNYDQLIFEGQMSGQSILVETKTELYVIPSFGIQWDKDLMNIAAFTLKQGNTDFFVEGSIREPLNLLVDQKEVYSTLNINAKRLDINQYMSQNDSLRSSKTSPVWLKRLKNTEIDLEAEIGELNYSAYNFFNSKLKGKYKLDDLQIDHFSALLSGSDFKLNGNLNNILAYNYENDTLSGKLYLDSKIINSNQVLEDKKKNSNSSASNYPVIPERTFIEIISSAEKIQYGALNIASVKGNLMLVDKQLELRGFEADLFGGNIVLEGSYLDRGQLAPEFALKYQMKTIPFNSAYQSLRGFKEFAPIFSFVEGVFNANLIMNGQLNERFLPVLSSLNAAGYMETNNTKVKSLPYFEKIEKFFTVNMKDAWNLTNTKNWFDIENGKFTLQEITHVWKDMEFHFAGTHGLDQQINYVIKAKVPKSKLDQSVLGQQITKTMDLWVQQAVDRGILKVKEEPFVLLDFNLSGNIKNPIVSVQPKGISGIEIANPVSSLIDEKKKELKDKASDQIEKGKNELKETVQDKVNTAKDSLQKSIQEATGNAVAKGKDKAQAIIDSTLKNQINQNIPDSLKTQIGKSLEDLFDEKSKDEVKNKLKDFNPFKKKKKNN